MAHQLSFDLPTKPALERDDFFISPSNALAVALIDTPQSWPAGKMILTGPQGAGKTHLASVFAAQTGARIIAASDLAAADIEALCTGPIVVEDLGAIAGDMAAETALFHLHNLAAAERRALLITSRRAPRRLDLSLPDLASRLGAAQIAELHAPDDALLSAVLMKLFNDRQVFPAPDVIPYLARRMDRSFADAQRIVALLDRAAMDRGVRLTRKLAATTLDKMTSPPA